MKASVVKDKKDHSRQTAWLLVMQDVISTSTSYIKTLTSDQGRSSLWERQFCYNKILNVRESIIPQIKALVN